MERKTAWEDFSGQQLADLEQKEEENGTEIREE